MRREQSVDIGEEQSWHAGASAVTRFPETYPRFLLLGPLGVTDGRDVIVLQPSKPANLLAALLLHPNSVVSVDFLQRVVWGEERPVTAKAALHTCVQRLRQLFAKYGIAGNLIEAVPGGYRIAADTGTPSTGPPAPCGGWSAPSARRRTARRNR